VEDAVREADIAVDFVPDELESKLEIFSMLDRMAPPRTILCTPTGALSISDLASCTYRPGLCVAFDVPDNDLSGAVLRVVRGRATSNETLGNVSAWLTALGFLLEQVEDTRDPMLTGPVSQDSEY
jgi:3-hydroxybutyryl-CoA dehydrogenase